MFSNNIEAYTVHQELWSRVQDTGAAWTKAACDKIRNIDLTNLKNHSLVKRAYNIGWKGPVAIIGVTLLGIGINHLRSFRSQLDDFLKLTDPSKDNK